MVAKSMGFARGLVFASIICLFLCGPVSLMLCERVDVPLPKWLTTEDSRYLSGGVEKVDLAGSLSVEGFLDGRLQRAIETTVGNFIPAKAEALLGNARLQRSAICLSERMFGWGVYPSYYGSSFLMVPDSQRLLSMPEKSNGEIIELCDRIATGIDDLANMHPEQRFFVYFAMDSPYLNDSPATRLVSDPLTYDQIEEAFKRDARRYTWVSGDLPYDEYNAGWYKTDHHWTVEGAYEAYCHISEAMGFAPAPIEAKGFQPYDGLLFYGTLARRGLVDEWPDAVVDTGAADKYVKSVFIDGEKADLASLHDRVAYLSGGWNQNRFANHYSELFHTDYALIEIEGNEPETNESLLIVSDSYTNCMEALFAAHYKHVYIIDSRFYEESVSSFIDEHTDVADVLFLMREAEFLSEETEKALELSR